MLRIKPQLHFIILVFLFATAQISISEPVHKGPLNGRNMFIPYLMYYHFPGFPAETTAKGQVTAALNTYLTNDIYVYQKTVNGEKTYHAIQDYENLTFEGDFSYAFTDRLEAGTTLRVLIFYGGFMDGVIETFHTTFGFLNGGREKFDYGRVEVDVENDNGVRLELDGPAAGFGDLDFWVKYGLFDNSLWSLSAAAAVKIPTGALSGVSVISSGYPDIAVQFLADFHPFRLFSFYGQIGFTLPGECYWPGSDADPLPFVSALLSAEFHPEGRFSVLAQFNFKSGMMTGDIDHWYFEDTDRLSLPQTNLLVGVKMLWGSTLWQFYFEEDPLTNQGTDITFNLRVQYQFATGEDKFGRSH